MAKALRKNDIKVLSDIEHVKLRPQIYVGSTKEEAINTYYYDIASETLKWYELRQVPALLKIIYEVIDNSVDECIRTDFKYAKKIDVAFDGNEVTVTDTGRGLPIEKNSDGTYTPETILTKLRAGSNFEDKDRMTLGQNGVGVSLTTIFSKSIKVDTANGHKRYIQIISNGSDVIGRPKLSMSPKNYTEISFVPDYEYFGASKEVVGNIGLFIHKRLKNLAFCYPEIVFTYNMKKISAKKLQLFLTDIHEKFEFSESDECRLGVCFSESDFQQISFVNGLETVRGGTHIDYLSSTMVEGIRAFIKKKHKLDIKPADIKNKLFIFFAMRMENSQFDGQTKERLVSNSSEFKHLIDFVLTERFIKGVCANEEIIEPIIEAYRLKEMVAENLKLKKLNKEKKIIIEKYYPAHGTNKYLVLVEGDSAAGSIMAIIGREKFSFFALKGKPLNTYDMKLADIINNEEMKNLIKILDFEDKNGKTSMSHENILIASDADVDGIHIRGLLLGFFMKFFPDLVASGRIKFLKTPLFIGFKGGKVKKYFLNMQDYNNYMSNEENEQYQWTYYKGLGSFEGDELEEIFKQNKLETFIESFESDSSTLLHDWLSKKQSDKRKEYLYGKCFDISKI